MKTVILNGSPRKNWNTAMILKEAQKGAEAKGDEVLYVDLYDLNFTGCRSCLACKRAGIDEPCKCYWKDEFSPVLEEIYKADHLILGSPIYFGQPTGVLREALERIVFPALSYNDYSSTFKGKVDVSVFLTMNVGGDRYPAFYGQKMEEYFSSFGKLNGKISIYPVCNTLQVNDYSKYEMKGFNPEAKKFSRQEQFPKDLEIAYKVGAREL